MAVIRFPAELTRMPELEPIHRTTPRPGIYVAPPPHAHHARRRRGPTIPATGRVARIHPYVADENQAVNRDVARALLTCAIAVGGAWLLVSGLRAGVHMAVVMGWVTP
ncbi:MAG: hypothetical protein ACTHK2_04665 [Dokdonella sp.]|uniref:hypothetical protein n=1 Tax=Dokdonella sp. TaxID=2291710 RepID=UPI003F812E96